jgi:hypothetical protein
LNALGFIAAAVASTTAIWVAFQTNQGLSDARQATNQAHKDTAEALSLAEDTSKEQLRAYVSASTVVIKSYRESRATPVVWYIEPVWKNSGQTPTRGAILRLGCFVDDSFTMPKKRSYSSQKTIGPGDTVLGGGCRQTPREISQQVSSDRERILSIIEYQDVFGARHVTKQCFEIQWRSNYEHYNPQPEYVIMLCPDGSHLNCEDDECAPKGGH